AITRIAERSRSGASQRGGLSTRRDGAATISRDIEGRLDGPMQLLELGGIASAHPPHQTRTRNGEDVVEVRDAAHGQALAPPELYLGRQPPQRASDEAHHHALNGMQDRVTGQDDDRPASDGRRELCPPDLASFHVPLAPHSETWVN